MICRTQIARLRLEHAALAEDAIQGHRLQALLDFQQHYVATTVAAQVIGTSGSELSRVVIYIDKGAKDGLKPDQAVITPDGIVGKLRDVFPHTSQVLLINDQTSGAGVLLATHSHSGDPSRQHHAAASSINESYPGLPASSPANRC